MKTFSLSLPDWPPEQRLALAVGIALALHLLALRLIEIPRADLNAPRLPAVLRWVDNPPAPGQSDRHDIATPAAGSRGHVHPQRKSPQGVGALPLPQRTEPTSAPLMEPHDQGPDLSLSARALARALGRSGESAPREPSAERPDRPVLQQLDQALRKETPGERRLAGGLLKVVTATGRVYCLQEPPPFAHDGITAPLALAGNCP